MKINIDTYCLKWKIADYICSILYYSGVINSIIFLRRAVFKKYRLIILAYHKVINPEYGGLNLNVSPDKFEKQIIYLVKHYNIVSLNRIVEYIKTQKIVKDLVAITFDDGYKDNYTNAFPILKKYRIPATIFLSTGFIDTGNLPWWEKLSQAVRTILKEEINVKLSEAIYPLRIRKVLADLFSMRDKNSYKRLASLISLLSEISEERRNTIITALLATISTSKRNGLNIYKMLSWKEINEMKDNNISFGCHTVSHRDLTKIQPIQIKEEILHSKVLIEEKINKPVVFFAYPYGEKKYFNDRVIKILKENGFLCACTKINGTNEDCDDLFYLRRNGIMDFSISVFSARLEGLFELKFVRYLANKFFLKKRLSI